MNKQILAWGLLLAATGVQGAEVGVKGGSHYAAAAINSEQRAAGVQYGVEYSRGNSARYLAEATLGYGFRLGALHIAPRLGLFRTDLSPSEGRGEGINGGIRLMAPVPLARSTWLYIDYSLSPDATSHHLHSLHQLETGVSLQPARWLTLRSGYRYIASDGNYGRQDRALADGLFIGAAWRF